jgi:dolichol-phosphate mannosyltransferase
MLSYGYMPKTAIVIPTYNEKQNVGALIGRIFALNVPELSVIFVDDNSPDGTAAIIKELAKKYPIELIERIGKLGLGSAYIAGFKKALAENFDSIFEMDADLSHSPEDIPRMIEASKNGSDLVIGSRKIAGGKIIGWNVWRHLMSNGAMITARLILGLKTKDVTAGFRCYKKSVLEKIDLDKIKSNGYAFQEEMLYQVEKNGYKVSEVPVTFTDRNAGESKLSTKDIWEFFKVMIKLR